MRPGSRRTGDPSQLRGVLWLPCCRLAGGDLRPCRKSIGGILQRRCQTCAAPAIAVICCIISETNSEKNAPGGRLSGRGNAIGGCAGGMRNPGPLLPRSFCRKLENNYLTRPTGYLAFLGRSKSLLFPTILPFYGLQKFAQAPWLVQGKWLSGSQQKSTCPRRLPFGFSPVILTEAPPPGFNIFQQ